MYFYAMIKNNENEIMEMNIERVDVHETSYENENLNIVSEQYPYCTDFADFFLSARIGKSHL